MVVAAVGLLLLQQVSTPTQLDGSGLPTIQQALSRVPDADVPGRDVVTVPRPAGSRRGYFIETKAVVSIVYSQHQDLLDVKHALQPALADDGWKELNIAPGTTPRTQPESTRTWRDVYFQGDRVLQVALFHNGDVTATTYVLQASTP